MNYSSIYCALISRRLSNPLSDCYVEKHHIIPKSQNGVNDASNLVYLSAREHYFAHLLLAKIYNNRSMWAAVHLMSNANRWGNRHRPSSRIIGLVREQFAKHQSEKLTGHKGYTKGRRLTIEQRAKISASMLGKPHPHKGHKHTEESRKKMSEAKIGYKHSEEAKMRMSIARKGSKLTEEHRKKISESNKGKHSSCPGNIGKKWFNDGVKNYFAFKCPDGCKEGMLKR